MVVTRFAPSPTGYLHVGGARTALFNWLWARHTGGKFLLRIEDTDIKRNTPQAVQQVIEDLRWLGIDWDEGPEVGGPNGPYLQSQRRDIYDKYIKQLLDEGKAYFCFDTPEELQAMRKEAEAEKKSLVYRRPKELPDENDVKKAKAEGRPVTVRFAVPQDEPIVVVDVVRGKVTFAADEISDFIIQKSDGFPTYNFACVVDDYLMKVTHVIRGQEHLNNTPSQQALWRALFGQIPLPKYAHMSVTISEAGGKLSKRERPKVLRKAEYIRQASGEKLLRSFKDYLKAIESPSVSANDELLVRIIKSCKGARTLADIERKSTFLFLANDAIQYDEKAVREVLLENDGLAVLQIVRDRVGALEQITVENIENMLRCLAQERQVGLDKVAQPLRVAICGTTVSLPIFDSVNMLGKENTLARIDITLKKYKTVESKK